MRKSVRMYELEMERGKSIQEVIVEEVRRQPSLRQAAIAMGISPPLLHKWLADMGIRYRIDAQRVTIADPNSDLVAAE